MAALVALAYAGAASAGGYLKTVRQTVSTDRVPVTSDWVHLRATYEIFDSRGYCIKDEDGFYDDDRCEDYDRGIAPVDLLVMRMAPRPRIVLSDRIIGRRGRVGRRIGAIELTWGGSCPGPVISYRAIFRLRDPVWNRVVDTRVKRFRLYCP